MAVIIVTVVSITVIGAITIMISLILYSMIGWQDSLKAQTAVDSLADDYIIRLIRDPALTPGPDEKLTVNDTTAYVDLVPAQTDGQPNVLTVHAASGNYVRTTQILYLVTDGETQILLRRETH